MTVKSILTEWTYRLPKGYPVEVKDYDVLREILDEMTDLPISKKEQIVRDIEVNSTSNSELENLVYYIEDTYKVGGQEIQNLEILSQKVLESPNKEKLLKIIYSDNPYYPLTRTDIRITGTALELYRICSTIKVTNGHWSELFFAIMFKGRVKGSVAGDEDNIKSDVVTDNPVADVSIKAYGKITYDCGMMPKEALIRLKQFISLGELLTGIDVTTSSMSTIDLNKILDELESERLQDEIKKIIEMEDSEFSIIRNAAIRIKNIMQGQSPDRLETVIDGFCQDLDETLHKTFVEQIQWWALFNTNNETLFLRPSAEIYDAVKCRKTYPRISPAIPNFHQGKVWLKGSEIGVFGTKYKD
jgi:hypothetical protein